MKKNIYLSVIAALFAGFTLTACSDFLEAENKTAGGQTADDYFGKDATSLLTSAYESMKAYAYIPDLFSRGTDLYIHTRGHVATVFDSYTITPEDNTLSSFYANVYKTINYANGVINYAGADSQLGQEARFLRNYGYYLLTQHFGGVPYVTEYINNGAERSYPRTPLSEIYASMISDLTELYSSSSLEAQSHKGHASKQAVAALLAKVYLAAGWDLDTTIGDEAQGTYSVNSTSNFSQAASWAEKAINGVSLTMPFDLKWSPYNEGNEEEIFSIQYERTGYPGDVSNSGHSMQNGFGGYYGNYNASGIKNVGSDDQQSEKSMYLFEKGDNRYDATFMQIFYAATKNASGQANWGDEGYYAYYNARDLSDFPITRVYLPYYTTEAEAEAWMKEHADQLIANGDIFANGNVIVSLLTLPNVTTWTLASGSTSFQKKSVAITDYNNQVDNGTCVKKFDDPNTDYTDTNNDYRDIVVLHVSDMYLVAAEANLMAGNTAEALAKINAVRDRAGLDALASFSAYQPEYYTTSTFTIKDIDLILDERARELYAEGHRWMDLRRTKQLIRYNVEFNEYVNSASDMQGNDGKYKWLRPIPANEISANTGISNAEQNPGY